MYRFKVSKYKNAAPKMPKKEECITEIPCEKVMASCGNLLASSGKHIAFNVDSGAGCCVGVLPINTIGRRNKQVPLLYGHTAFVTDMCFSPFDDDLLATCSHDGQILLWNINDNIGDNSSEPISKMTTDNNKIEIVQFHPTADELLTCAVYDSIHIYDLNDSKMAHSVEVDSILQSFSWKQDGSLMVTSSKDLKNRVIDPRNAEISQEFNGFHGNKDSRLVWFGDGNYIFGTGFNKGRSRVIGLWDIRNTNALVFQEDLQHGSGILMPFHDADTNMIVLAGKGDQFASLYEFNEETTNISLSSIESLGYQTFGMGRTPKRVMNVMVGEVNRFFQLAKNTIVPLPYIIPRKSYREFHADLFPDTIYSGVASMTAAEWLNGKNMPPIKISLDPKISNSGKTVVGSLKSKTVVVDPPKENAVESEKLKEPVIVEPKESTSTSSNTENKVVKKPSKFNAGHQSRFKHLVGKTLHKSNNIENVKNLAESLSTESDGFKVMKDFVCVPLSGSGGRIAVLQLSKPGRLPDFDIPVLQNGSNVLDFDMDPFDNTNIAVGCDDWKIRIWKIPEGGLLESMDEPIGLLSGHEQRVTIVQYHPTATNILTSAGLDFNIIVWDLDSLSEIGVLEGHTDQILCLSWHPDGKQLATLCKDGKIRVYDPVEDVEPIKEGDGPSGVRCARISWCGPKNNWLIVSAVTGDGRTLHLYDSKDFAALSSLTTIDYSPSVLSIFYDESSQTLMAYGKGDRTILAFEVHEEAPHLFALSLFHGTDIHLSVAFLQKNLVDVRKVEFLKAVRLTKSNIEIISFTLPRVKMEYFQDDVFPDIRVTWQPAITGESWLDGEETESTWISLKPADMKKLSEAPKEAPKEVKYCSREILSEKTDEEKKAELINAMMGKLDTNDKLEQDDFEGVEEDEWDE